MLPELAFHQLMKVDGASLRLLPIMLAQLVSHELLKVAGVPPRPHTWLLLRLGLPLLRTQLNRNAVKGFLEVLEITSAHLHDHVNSVFITVPRLALTVL